jgi:hypothetical protein
VPARSVAKPLYRTAAKVQVEVCLVHPFAAKYTAMSMLKLTLWFRPTNSPAAAGRG